MWPPGGRLSHDLSLPSHLANVLATQKPDSSANGFGCFFFFFLMWTHASTEVQIFLEGHLG